MIAQKEEDQSEPISFHSYDSGTISWVLAIFTKT
jgi:hypothetical protein